MKPIILNADYMVSPDEIPDITTTVEIHFTRFGDNKYPGGEPSFADEDSYKIFCHVNEPTTSRWVEPVLNIIKHSNKYDKIVTSNPEILTSCLNSKFMIYGTTWLNKSKHHPDSFGKYSDDLSCIEKDCSISMVCGSLHGKLGYNIRHAIFLNQDKINAHKKFYSSSRFPIQGFTILPDDDKINLFSSMYSVVVESSSEPNYITEKLIDCLVTKTIPVYWGCPNVSDFFDTSYWIPIDKIFEFSYTEDYYNKNLDKINYNFEKAKIYCRNIIERVIEA